MSIETNHIQPASTFTESLDITNMLGRYFPSLYPQHLSPVISSLLDELHQITYFSLTYEKSPHRATDMENAVMRLLADTNISDRHRQALEFKMSV